MANCEEIKEYVITVWNYSQAVVDAFDDEDYRIVKNTTSFKLWLIDKRISTLLQKLGVSK